MRKLITYLFSLLIVFAVNSQGIISTVSFEFNDSWKRHHDPEISDSIANIGYRYLGDSAYSFRVDALIRVSYVPRTITVNHAPIDYLAESIRMSRILTASEGQNWKSSIFVANEEDSQHITFHRIGVLNGVALELMLFFENNGEESDLKVLTLDETNVIGDRSGLVTSESLGNEMITIYKSICETLEIFAKKEDSFSFVLINVPESPAKVYRKN